MKKPLLTFITLVSSLVVIYVLFMYLMVKNKQRIPDDESESSRKYFLTDIKKITAGKNFHTHIEVQGRVTYISNEKDGDLHFRVSNGDGFVVCECIPKLPCPRPTMNQEVTVSGISRYDGEHKWYEIHPVEEWK